MFINTFIVSFKLLYNIYHYYDSFYSYADSFNNYFVSLSINYSF